jgi:hypothetical protein
MESVQLALARQDVKERECAIIVDAGRVTATARADIDAFRARRKAWVRGCVQICDDARSSSGDLDWEFALHSCPGHSAGMEVPWLSRVIEGVISCRSCIPMLPGDVGASEPRESPPSPSP